MSKEATTLLVDADAKANACALFDELGLDLLTAVNMFLRQAVYEHAIPFTIHRETPNAETRAALEEGDRLALDSDAKTFHSLEELLEDLENPDE